MRLKFTVLIFFIFSVIYFSLLFLNDNQSIFFGVNYFNVKLLPFLMFATFISFLIRFIRWYWLLNRLGHSNAILNSFLIYLAGFAFTATPGKVGELFRARYLERIGVRSSSIISTLIYERSADLITIIFLSIFFGWKHIVTILILLLSLIIIIFLNKNTIINFSYLRILNGYLREGLTDFKKLLNIFDMSISIILGFIAWTITSITFIYLLSELNIFLPWPEVFGVYPSAILIGAGSMLPGGVGSTEASLIAILSIYGISLENSVVAAIAIRVSTLWFSIACGLLSILILEIQRYLVNRRLSKF